MKLVKQIGYKLIVILCIVMTFCCFIASTPVEASKVNTSEFYYSGTVKGSYTVEKGFFEKLVEALDQILDYILGILTMGVRIVFVGWTALLERCLTWILEGATGEDVEIDNIDTNNITGSDDYITLDAIFFNRVPLLDINIFNFELRDDVTATGMKKEETEQGKTEEHDAPMIIYTDSNVDAKNTIVQGEKKDYYQLVPEDQRPGYQGPTTPTPYAPGQELQQQQQETENETGNEEENNKETGTQNETTEEEEKESLVMILKKAIAGWYYTFRLISIMVMLVLLVYIGVKLAIQSSTTEKALYKRVLFDWLVGMILVFSIHYIMIAIIQFNEILVDQISNLREGATELKVYEYGLIERAQKPIENDELEMTLYEEVKTRAYDAKLTVGAVGMVMYMVLVYYAWKYTFIYLKRYLTVAVLVIVAPLVAVSYAFNKVNSGKSKIFTNWFKEFFFTVILQSIHALMYVIFLDTALAISLSSVAGILLVFMLLNFMCKAEGIFRKIFNVSGNLANDIAEGGGLKDAINNLKGGMVAMGAGKFAAKFTKGAVKLSTKPLAVAGSYGFGKFMEKQANSQSANNRINKIKNDNLERNEKIRYGSIAKAIQSNQINVEELTKTVNSLKEKKGQFIKNQNGESVEVNDEYIAAEEKALAEIIKIDSKKDELAAQYDKMTTNRALLGHYIKGKWGEIMDPHQYTKKVDGKYEAVKTRREYGKLGKKKDSVGKRLAANLSISNLTNLDKNTKAALKQQKELVKNEILGFTGILMGLPMLVAEPAAGAIFLYQGVQNSSKILSLKGKERKKELKKMRLMPNGKYKLVGFEGASKQTIANEAKRQAREQVEEIYLGKAKQDANMVSRVRKKHPKVYAKLKGAVEIGGMAGTTFALATLTPVTLPIAAVSVTAATISGAGIRSGRGRMGSNVWAAYHETVKAARRANTKLNDQEVKNSDAYLSFLAEKYFEMEADQNKDLLDKSAEKLAIAHATMNAEEAKKIDKMESAVLQRELEFENVELQRQADGKLTLSGSSENNVIDNAIIETVQKNGIMDIEAFELSATNMESINKAVTNKLRQLGLVNQDVKVSEVIQDLDKKIKTRKAILDKQGTKPVEEKMVDQAIIQSMGNETNPDLVNQNEVMDKFYKIHEEIYGKSKPTDESKSVTDKLQSEKTTDASQTFNISQDGTRTVNESDKLRISQMIVARKSILSAQSKTQVNSERAGQMKEMLKRKKAVELETILLENESNLESGQNIEIDNYEGRNSDDIIKLLQLQTKVHQDKLNLQKSVNSMSDSEKKAAYREMIFDDTATLRRDFIEKQLNPNNDGSRRVKNT